MSNFFSVSHFTPLVQKRIIFVSAFERFFYQTVAMMMMLALGIYGSGHCSSTQNFPLSSREIRQIKMGL
jgi:hypothetical protein